jgi:ATP-dependent Clp protease ATP-binding subunit ClpC
VFPFERFTEDAKEILVLAQQEAERASHSYIGTEHLLLGVLRGGGDAGRILVELGVDEAAAKQAFERVIGRRERVAVQQIIPTNRVKKTLELAVAAATREDSASVTPEHVVIGLIEEGEGIAAHVLSDMGVTLERFQQAR